MPSQYLALLVALGAALLAFVSSRGRERKRKRLVQTLRAQKEQREILQEELRVAYRHLRDLGRHLQVIQEEERGRIAARIHDDLGQALTSLSLDLAWLNGHLPDGSAPSDADPSGDRNVPDPDSEKKDRVDPDLMKLRQRMESMGERIDATLSTVRRLAGELKPRVLEGGGLVRAMEWLVEDQCSRAGLEFTVETSLERPEDLLPELTLTVFRNLQELLVNVIRHAGARSVEVTLDQEGNQVCLAVKDDGLGFDPETLNRDTSFGFFQVEERAHYWGGVVEVESAPGQGAEVRVRLPLLRS